MTKRGSVGGEGDSEAIAQSGDGFDVVRLNEVGLAPESTCLGDLAPQSVYQLANHVAVSAVGAPYVFDDGLGGQDMPGVEHQVVEQPAFQRRE